MDHQQTDSDKVITEEDLQSGKYIYLYDLEPNFLGGLLLNMAVQWDEEENTHD